MTQRQAGERMVADRLTERVAAARPSVPMRVVAQMLAERGFDVRRPEPRYEESRHLTVIDAKSARCEIDVYDDEDIVWEYFPRAGGSAEPAEISSVVRRALDADKTPPAGLDTRLRRMGTLKGMVACEMRARGLKADLEVYENHEEYDVVAEVVLTNPARPGRGVVRIADDGVIRWECNSGEMPGGSAVIADATTEALVIPPAREEGRGAEPRASRRET